MEIQRQEDAAIYLQAKQIHLMSWQSVKGEEEETQLEGSVGQD